MDQLHDKDCLKNIAIGQFMTTALKSILKLVKFSCEMLQNVRRKYVTLNKVSKNITNFTYNYPIFTAINKLSQKVNERARLY